MGHKPDPLLPLWHKTSLTVMSTVGNFSYLKVLPPNVDGRKGQLHLLPAGVFMAFISDFDEDKEDPCGYASSHQHEDTLEEREQGAVRLWFISSLLPLAMIAGFSHHAQWLPPPYSLNQLLLTQATTLIKERAKLQEATSQETEQHSSTQH